MSKHSEIEQLIAVYRELNVSQKRRVDGHLRSCDACRQQFETFQQTDRQIHQLGRVTPSPTLKSEFHARLQQAQRRPRLWSRSPSPVRLPLRIAGVLAMALFALTLWFKVLPNFGSEATQPTWSATRLTTVRENIAAIYSVSISQDGRLFAVANSSRTVNLWQTSDGALLQSWERTTASPYAIRFSPDNGTLALGGGHMQEQTGSLHGWSLESGVTVLSTQPFTSPITALAYATDSTLLAVGQGENVIIMDARSGAVRHTLKLDTAYIEQLAFSPDNRLLAVAVEPGRIQLWHVADGRLDSTLLDGETIFSALEFSPDGRFLAAAHLAHCRVQIWDVRDGSVAQTLSTCDRQEENAARDVLDERSFYIPVARHYLLDLTFSSDGKQLITGSAEGNIQFWNLGNGSLIAELQTDKAVAIDLYAGQDRTLVVSGWHDGRVQLWELRAPTVR